VQFTHNVKQVYVTFVSFQNILTPVQSRYHFHHPPLSSFTPSLLHSSTPGSKPYALYTNPPLHCTHVAAGILYTRNDFTFSSGVGMFISFLL